MPRKKTTPSNDSFDFEKSLEQLTKLVERMERGNLPLEESLQYFEQGISLIRECQAALTNAEQKVQLLTTKNGAHVLTDYKSENSHDS